MAEKQHVPSIIVLRGLPGSSKTTWALEYLRLFPKSVRVSRDDLRKSLFNKSGRLSREEENLITKAEDALVIAGLADGNDVLVDATNLPARAVKRFAKLGPVHQQIFNTPPEECIARQAGRERKVPAEVINDMAARFMQKGRIPEVDLTETRADGKLRKVAPPSPLKADAIVLDIDNTIAHLNGRGPYDTSLYHTDTLDENVATVIRELSRTFPILVVSGRSDEFEHVTREWLEKHHVPHDAIFMRRAGDTRKDWIVKHELYWEHIAPDFNVVMAFDDRVQVCEMWRAIGIKVAQVEVGDF